jgi:capsular exopolysaccharide synthesis family protein
MKMNFFSRKRASRAKQRYEGGANFGKPYLLDKNSAFGITEAFRSLKASLSVSVPKKESDGSINIMVTSNFPGEGKTTVTVNTALMFAQSNFKVLVVDADIRRGRVAKFFKAHHKPGLSDYLSGQNKVEEILAPSEIHPNLYFIPRGTTSAHSYELLESEAMKELMDKLASEFDYILLDTPPVKLVADALALVPVTRGTLIVCKHMHTYESDLRSTLDALAFAKANVLGVVMNDYHISPRKLKGGYKKYYSSYAFGYGYMTKEETEATPEAAPVETEEK